MSGQQCTLKTSELPAAPELLGFRLGMNREQIKAQVPQVVFGRTDPFGVSKTTINPHFDPRIDPARFEGVRSISLDLLDDRLVSLWIGYDETFKVQRVDDFVKMISQSLHLAGRWTPWRSKGQQMRCLDFQVTVTTLAGSPSFRPLDTTADEAIAARRIAREELDSAAEATAAVNTNVTGEIVGDKLTKTYYPTGCQPEKEIAGANKVSFKTPQEAEQAGYKLAKNCR